MAVARTQMQNCLRNVLHIPLDVILALREQGSETLDDLDSINMEEMKTACRNCRQPGGTMDNPALAVAADADAAARMPLFVAN